MMRSDALARASKLVKRIGLPNPTLPHRPNPSSSCLFVCDMQETFRKRIAEFPMLTTNIEFAMRTFTLLGSDIYVSEQKPFPPTVDELRCLYDPCITVEGSAPLNKHNITVYTKSSFSMLPEMPQPAPVAASAAPPAPSEGYRDVFVVGIESHVCVMQTVVDLLAPAPVAPLSEAGAGTAAAAAAPEAGASPPRVWVLSDAVGSICSEPSEKDVALNFMRSLGANVISTEAAMFLLMGTSARSEFKPFLELVKRKNRLLM